MKGPTHNTKNCFCGFFFDFCFFDESWFAIFVVLCFIFLGVLRFFLGAADTHTKKKNELCKNRKREKKW